MYFTICRITDNSNRQIAEFITAGFSSQLKGWWDHHLTPVEKFEVLGATKVDPNTNQIKEEAVYRLISTILFHFVGGTNAMNERTQDMIMNLKCLTLIHFR